VRQYRRRIGACGACCLTVLILAGARTSGAQSTSEPTWRDVDGGPLPFQSEADVLEFLRSGHVVSERTIGTGINESRKILLEKDGVRAHAIFRDVDVGKETAKIAGTTYRFFADSYRFEPAAFELARTLGLESIPPAVNRRVGRREGSAQIWVEDTVDEESGEFRPPSAIAWAEQVQDMDLFDNLVYNIDRNAGNLLVGSGYRLWMIDHTRAFQLKDTLLNDRIRRVRRRTWERLVALDEEALTAQLSSYLTPLQLRSLWRRRERIIEYVNDLVHQLGEDAIFFE